MQYGIIFRRRRDETEDEKEKRWRSDDVQKATCMQLLYSSTVFHSASVAKKIIRFLP